MCSDHNIVYYKANGTDIKLSGGSSRCGILLVEGYLEVHGGFSWHGVILVTGSIKYTGGRDKQVTGGCCTMEQWMLIWSGEMQTSCTAALQLKPDCKSSSAALELERFTRGKLGSHLPCLFLPPAGSRPLFFLLSSLPKSIICLENPEVFLPGEVFRLQVTFGLLLYFFVVHPPAFL